MTENEGMASNIWLGGSEKVKKLTVGYPGRNSKIAKLSTNGSLRRSKFFLKTEEGVSPLTTR